MNSVDVLLLYLKKLNGIFHDRTVIVLKNGFIMTVVNDLPNGLIMTQDIKTKRKMHKQKIMVTGGQPLAETFATPSTFL